MSTGDDLDLARLSFAFSALRHTSMDERWSAAASAGFSGISVDYGEIVDLRRAGVSVSSIRVRAADLGLRLTELEWFNLAATGSEQVLAELASDMAETASQLGCSAVTGFAKSDVRFGSPAREREQLGGLLERNVAIVADACANVGLVCSIEFMPFASPVDSLVGARELLTRVGKDNTGLTLDAMHFFRSGADWAQLEALEPAEVLVIQLCDAPRQPRPGDYATESREYRLCPGEGELDLVRFISTLSPFPKPLTVEVPNRFLRAMAPESAAGRMARSTKRLLGSMQV